MTNVHPGSFIADISAEL